MATWLKQSTAVEIKLGPFLDSGDGNTVEDGLTISQADVTLAKNGGDWAQKNESTSLVHESQGWYRCLLDTTDTNTLGILIVKAHESGALQVWREFMVVAANIYDSMIGGGDLLQVDMTQIEGADASDTLAALDDAVLAAVAGVQSDTNDIQTRLPAALGTGGNIKADIRRVNDIAVDGAGTAGDPWGPV